MGVRFKKQVKLTKGSKINIAKTGASISFGGKGHSLNIGKNGPTATVGIPGTGLSYRQKIGTSHNNSHKIEKRSNPVPSSPKTQSQIEIHMDDKGHIVMFDGQGKEITDQSEIRKIQSTPQFAQQKAILEQQRREKIEEIINESKKENDTFINIYKLAPIVEDYNFFATQFEQIRPREYEMIPFDVPKPTEENIREILIAEAKKNVRASIFTAAKLRKKYVDDCFDERFCQAVLEWENSKNDYYFHVEEEKRQAQIAYQKEYDNQKTYLKSVIEGDEKIISELFDYWIESCVLPVEININYECDSINQGLLLDVDLPEIEDIPNTIMTKTDAGNLKEKKKTQTELKKEYTTLTFGLAIFIVANVFNISPAIENVLISGYTQRRDGDGNIKDDYIYSIKFKRESFEGIDLTKIDPKDLCLMSENRCNLTSTSLFKTIKPFESL